MINLKTAHEIDLMARAGRLLASVLPPLEEACKPGVRTADLGGDAGTSEFTDEVIRRTRAKLEARRA